MKNLVLIVIVLTLFAKTTQSFAADSKDMLAKLRVGIPLPLSGDLQTYGVDLRNSFIVAKELLAANEIELFFEDDRCDAKLSVSVAQKFVEFNKVDVVTGIYCNHALFPAAPIYNRKDIPVITTGATTGDVKGVGRKIFRLFPADQLGVKPLLKVITNEHKRLCMLTVTDTYTELIQRTVKKEFGELKAPYALFAQEVDGANKDFRTLLLSLGKNSCDALFLNSPGDDTFISMMKQAREQKVAMPIYAFYMPGSDIVRKALGVQLNGVVYADIPSRDEVASDLGKKFIKAYNQQFGEFHVAQPVGLFAFEALRLIVEAHKAHKALDEYVRGRKIVDGAIKDYSFDEDGAIDGLTFKVLRYQDGKADEVL